MTHKTRLIDVYYIREEQDGNSYDALMKAPDL